MAIAVLGIDLGKNSCSVAGLDGTGRVVLRRRLTRERRRRTTSGMPRRIAEAATRPTMRFVVELKSEAQLDAQILHRARSRLVGHALSRRQPSDLDRLRCLSARLRQIEIDTPKPTITWIECYATHTVPYSTLLASDYNNVPWPNGRHSFIQMR